MLHVACCLWDSNSKSQSFSRCYDETWVEKLYRGFRRNLTIPFRFVVFVDRLRDFKDEIEQRLLVTQTPDYGCLIEPFSIGEPSIITGLDTVIVGNIDHLADYCLKQSVLALPRDPYQPQRSINPVALVPRSHRYIYEAWRGENDMDWLRKWPNAWIDDLWPGQVVSLKAHKVRDTGLRDARIVYMHGNPKANELLHLDWVKEYWR